MKTNTALIAIVSVTLLLAEPRTVTAAITAGPITNAANGHVYFLLSRTNWTAAEAEAVGLGGHLATVRSQAEQDWIYSTFSRWGGINRNLWIGLHDTTPTNNSTVQALRRAEFFWVSREPVTFTYWSPVEPLNPQSSEPEFPELYVHIWQPGDFYDTRWNNYHDFSTLPRTNGVPMNGVVEVVGPAPRLTITRQGQEVRLCWDTTTNRQYQLQRRTEFFTSDWSDFGGIVAGTGATNCVLDTAVDRQKFYRVVPFP